MDKVKFIVGTTFCLQCLREAHSLRSDQNCNSYDTNEPYLDCSLFQFKKSYGNFRWRTLDPPLSPPSTPAEICHATTLQKLWLGLKYTESTQIFVLLFCVSVGGRIWHLRHICHHSSPRMELQGRNLQQSDLRIFLVHVSVKSPPKIILN
jgi:hypothetical protein